MEEVWKDIIGYEGLYQVSNLGRVKSLDYDRTGREQVLKPKMDINGYLSVTIYKNRKRKYPRINRLVAMAFIPIPDHLKHLPLERLEADHIDTDRTNNAVWNLRWTDRSGNRRNPLTRQHMSEAHKGMKHTEETKRKLSEANKGENHPMYGKHHTEETKRKLSKQVLQLDKDTGEVIREWLSTRESGRQGFNHSHIAACCRGERKTAYGFKWQYAV